MKKKERNENAAVAVSQRKHQIIFRKSLIKSKKNRPYLKLFVCRKNLSNLEHKEINCDTILTSRSTNFPVNIGNYLLVFVYPFLMSCFRRQWSCDLSKWKTTFTESLQANRINIVNLPIFFLCFGFSWWPCELFKVRRKCD